VALGEEEAAWRSGKRRRRGRARGGGGGAGARGGGGAGAGVLGEEAARARACSGRNLFPRFRVGMFFCF
jgi:hypothetical protein